MVANKIVVDWNVQDFAKRIPSHYSDKQYSPSLIFRMLDWNDVNVQNLSGTAKVDILFNLGQMAMHRMNYLRTKFNNGELGRNLPMLVSVYYGCTGQEFVEDRTKTYTSLGVGHETLSGALLLENIPIPLVFDFEKACLGGVEGHPTNHECLEKAFNHKHGGGGNFLLVFGVTFLLNAEHKKSAGCTTIGMNLTW